MVEYDNLVTNILKYYGENGNKQQEIKEILSNLFNTLGIDEIEAIFPQLKNVNSKKLHI
jgi:hypothetical protein